MAEPRPGSPFQETEETTPLLATTDGGESSSRPQGAELQSETAAAAPVSTSSTKLFQNIKRTTYVSIASSIVALIFLLATFITTTLSPYSWYHNWIGYIFDLGITILISLVLTVLNLSAIRHPFPPQSSSSTSATISSSNLAPRSTFFYLPLTICIDIIFACFIFGLAGSLFSDTPFDDYYCNQQQAPGHRTHVADCYPWELALRILGYLSIAATVVVGFCHLLLFIFRSMTALRYGLWSHPTLWLIPTTGISINLTVKVLGSESADAAAAAEA